MFLWEIDKISPKSPENITLGSIALNLLTMFTGMAFWIDWLLDEDTVISDGPTEEVIVGRDIVWTKHSKQGVFLLSHLDNLSKECSKDIKLKVIFDPDEGDLKFEVK